MLIQTVPALMRRAIALPRSVSSVQTLAESPKGESLAIATMASSSSATITGNSGPKVSSRMTRISGVTSRSTVGA
ncbi:hypothetical protein D3C86_1847250 [compost metagenome]